MLDTKLKKTHKKTNLIIALIVLLPAIILTALSPQMERAALELLKGQEEQDEAIAEDDSGSETYWKELSDGFDNMAVEASYYMYGLMLQDRLGQKVDMSVLKEYGWINDFYYIDLNTVYMGVFSDENETHVTTNAEWDMAPLLELSKEELRDKYDSEYSDDYAGVFTIGFNSYGELKDVQLITEEEILAEVNPYASVIQSMDKYTNNVEAYNWNSEKYEEVDPDEMVPKNFQAVFLIKADCDMIYDYVEYRGTLSWSDLYLTIGTPFLILALACLVALAALILPFIKKLETGWERLFSIPALAVIVLCIAGALGACGMYLFTAYMNLTNLRDLGSIHIIGIEFTTEVVYGAALAAELIGWSACFLAEYTVVSAFRQFLCNPKKYLKERLLFIGCLSWLKKQCKRLADYLMDIDIHDKLHSGILKIVLVNFVVLVLLCSIWWFGIAGVAVYSCILYILLRKFGETTREKYEKVLDATKQMAEGNLKFTLEEDLGIFTPIGQELERVQYGFSKAVMEEAKSQNMKTELITNVSHDLKTPLTAIITYIDLLKKEDLTEEERESYIRIIDQKSQRLKVLIEDLFEVSKAASGNIQMNFMDVDVVDLMKQVRLEMEEKIQSSELTFKWNLPEEKVILSLDGQKTYRIFENLLNNILKYSLPHSRVYIDIINEEKTVQILMKNISATELEGDVSHLTERFVRGDASRKTEGSGLGLAIVKSFVELQNGKLDISVDGDLFKVTMSWQKQ